MNPNSSRDNLSTPNGRIQRYADNDMQTGMSGNPRDNNQNPQKNEAHETRNPTYSDGFTMVPPNESKRNKLQSMAQKELEDLSKYKEEHRPGPIHLTPEKLGGCVSLAEVRQKQQVEVRQSKLQKKLKKEEMDRMKRQAEEEENQRMKAIQREKANRLEKKKIQEEEQRKELYQHDLRMKREEYIQKLEMSNTVPMVASNSTPTSSWQARGHEYKEARKAEEKEALQQMKEEQRRKSENLEEKQKQQEEDRMRRVESEHLRVNKAFLDRLEARGSGRASESHPFVREDGNIWQTEEPQDPASSPVPFPSQVYPDSSEEEEDIDHEWTVMRLQSDFPYYERDLLEDIVSQCNGNYKQAYDLLSV